MHKQLSRIALVLVSSSFIYWPSMTFAESAPVYDADSMQPYDSADAQEYGSADDEAYVPGRASFPRNSVALSVDQRMRMLEQQVKNMQASSAEARVEALQNQVQNLQGQVEQLTHQLEQALNQQKSMYNDIDKRLQTATSGKSAPTVAMPPSSTASASKAVANTKAAAAKVATDENQPNVAEEQQIYQTAYNLIKARRYDDAVAALQNMLHKYPSGQFASNAHYWLGELYGLLGKNDKALNEFSSVMKSYPDSPRVSDSQLKIGLIYAAQSKWADAKSAFKQVIKRYPGTASAKLATEQLKELKNAGH